MDLLTDPNQLWPGIQHLCNRTNTFILDKSGFDLQLLSRCHQVKEFAMSNTGMIGIALGLVSIILLCLFALKKLNSRKKSFFATLINVKEITHDTKIFTFDLPNGWNSTGLKIGEHLTLTYFLTKTALRSMARFRKESIHLFRESMLKETHLIFWSKCTKGERCHLMSIVWRKEIRSGFSCLSVGSTMSEVPSSGSNYRTLTLIQR